MSSIHASGRRRRPGGGPSRRRRSPSAWRRRSGYLVAGTGAQASNAAPAITANPPEPAEPPEPPPPPPPTAAAPDRPAGDARARPGTREAPSTTASPTTTTATDTTDENTTTSTVPTATGGDDANASAAPSQYTVTVTRAEVGCDGTIRGRVRHGRDPRTTVAGQPPRRVQPGRQPRRLPRRRDDRQPGQRLVHVRATGPVRRSLPPVRGRRLRSCQPSRPAGDRPGRHVARGRLLSRHPPEHQPMIGHQWPLRGQSRLAAR